MSFYSLNRNANKKFYNYFSYKSRKELYHNKINRLVKLKKCKPLTKDQIDEIKAFYASFGIKGVNTNWHRYFTHMNSEFHKEYIPEDIFYNIIEPSLNMVDMSSSLTDKNLLNRIIKKVKQPLIIIKNINGYYYSEDQSKILNMKEVLEVCKTHNKMVIKPSIDTYGGNNVVVFTVENDKTDYNDLSLEELIKSYKKNFIIQGWIDQHEKISSLNPSSVNTIRSKSLFVNGEVKILNNVLRVGSKDAHVDNTGNGGLRCIVNDDGSLKPQGYNANDGLISRSHTDVDFENFKIPNYERVKEVVKQMHQQIPYFKMVSWDIAIDKKEEPVLVEFNVISQGIFSQHGYGPLFGNYTKEVLSGIEYNKFKTDVRHILM